jgi:hypothetical protein
MNEDASLPQPFSRMEIATIAAMLLGKFAQDNEYRSACESALNLLTVAEEVADRQKTDMKDTTAIPWEILDLVEVEPSSEFLLQEKLLRLGFKTGSKLDPERETPLPWAKFWGEVLHPKKPSNRRQKDFEAWLRSKVSTAEEAASFLHALKEKGVPKLLVRQYLQGFQSWWTAYRRERNSASAQAAAKKRKNANK